MTQRYSLIALVLCFLPGCHTVGSQIVTERGSRVFTGTRAHIAAMASPDAVSDYWVPQNLGSGFIPIWFPLDLPLSLAADLVMLPYTVPAQLILGDIEFSNPVVRYLIAAATDDIALARELIEEHPQLVHEHYGYADSPLLAVVAATGQPKFVAFLLESGANVNAVDERGKSALYYAVDHRSTVESIPLYVEEREAMQKRAKYVDVVRLLMKRGAGPNDSKNARYYVSPLLYAARLGNLDLVRVMVENGARATARDKDGGTPLHDAAFGGHSEVARFLLEQGADANARRDSGITPLHSAAFRGQLEVARFLIERGADVNARNNSGETPLGAALRHDKHDVAGLLRAHGGKN